jgi:hypothetical protein
MSGMFGVISTPLALTRNRAVTESPLSRSTRHVLSASSKLAPSTFVLNLILGRRPYLSTQCSA